MGAQAEINEEGTMMATGIDVERCKYPCSIVWTPIPFLTWFCPVVGHMGIGLSNGVIRDFAGSYYVSEDNMAFGRPTKYWQLNPDKVQGGKAAWDRGVYEASEEYKGRTHNLCCDNCHSHVAMALNTMSYGDSSSWNMFRLAFNIFFCGKYVSFGGFLKTWLPFLILLAIVITLCCVL